MDSRRFDISTLGLKLVTVLHQSDISRLSTTIATQIINQIYSSSVDQHDQWLLSMRKYSYETLKKVRIMK